MKKVTSILMLGIAVAVFATVSPLNWKTTSLDLGQIVKGESQELSFEFENTTNETIRILEAKGSCGCTKVEYPEDIKPGETASITADFKSTKLGAFKKNIKIRTSESEDYTYLYFSGEIIE